MYLIYFIIYLFWLCWVLVAACMQDLVPSPGFEPGPPALGARSLTQWTTKEVPGKILMLVIYAFNSYSTLWTTEIIPM